MKPRLKYPSMYFLTILSFPSSTWEREKTENAIVNEEPGNSVAGLP
jgi:hypothetical protein